MDIREGYVKGWTLRPEAGDTVADLQAALRALPRLASLDNGGLVRSGRVSVVFEAGSRAHSLASHLDLVRPSAPVATSPPTGIEVSMGMTVDEVENGG